MTKTMLVGMILCLAGASPFLRADLLTTSVWSGSTACFDSSVSSAKCSASSGFSSASSSLKWGVDQSVGGLALLGDLHSSNGASRSFPSASLSAIIKLPSSSMNWILTGILSDQSDDNIANSPVRLGVYANNNLAGYIVSGSDPSQILIHHQAGTPISLSLSASIISWNAFSSDTLHFSLGLVDPPDAPTSAAPEPNYFYVSLLIAIVFCGIALVRQTLRML